MRHVFEFIVLFLICRGCFALFYDAWEWVTEQINKAHEVEPDESTVERPIETVDIERIANRMKRKQHLQEGGE